jgi:hypothetical protein
LGETILWSDATESLDAGEGAPEDVLEAWIIAGQSAGGVGQAPELVGERLGGESEVDGIAPDGVMRGDAQHVLADQFLEAFERLLLDDGDHGEQA